ncbi:MAG: CerR family C-terminal domain-containing protein [Alphaproteobacteria bacterium]
MTRDAELGEPVREEVPAGRAKPAADARKRSRRRADGDASRARLLEAAGKLFANRGFAAASTRALARAAKVNLSAIAYHFGDKEGLYREVLRRLIADSGPIMQPVVERLHAGVALAAGDRDALAGIAAGFLRHLLGSVLSDERMRWQMALMLREFHEPSAHFAMVLDERIHPLHDAVAELVGAATGRPANAAETRLLTASVIGQCMALGAARTVVCARLGWDGYTPERVDFIIRTVTPAVLAMLGLPAVDEARGTIS